MGRRTGSTNIEPSFDFLAGQKLNYEWTNTEIDEVIKLYNNKANLFDLHRDLNRDVIETMILIDDLIRLKRLDSNRRLELR